MSARNLYRGEERGRPLGEILNQMARKGLAVHRGQQRRWKENRLMYRGDQWLQVNLGADQVKAIQRDSVTGRKRDVVNRLRQFVDARVSLMTAKRPPFEVRPERNDQDHIDAARQATKVVSGKWDDWRLDERMVELALAGDIDGVAFLSVIYDSQLGKKVSIPVSNFDKKPVTDPAMEEQLRRAGMLSHKDTRLGEVSIRVVRAPQLAVDPFMDNDWQKARWCVESRMWPRHEVEAMAGGKMKDLAAAAARTTTNMTAPRDSFISLEDSTGPNSNADKDAVLVHEAFIKPHGDWPKGAHVVYTAENPGKPLLMEEWDDELPYYPYVPRPDGGNIIRSRGTVDELRDSQVRFNRNLTQVSEWMDRVARPPLMVQQGAVRSKTIYNKEGAVFYLPGYDKPDYLRTPAEPAVMLKDHLGFSVNQMQELSGITNPSRGLSPGQGVESAVAIDQLIEQTEQSLSVTEKSFVRAFEWGVSRALMLVGKHYIVPRMIAMPGVDDREEMVAFVGKTLKGTHRFKVTGTIMPKSQASQMQTLLQLAPMLGPKIVPWLGKIVEGDLDQFFAAEEMERRKQSRENRKLAALGAEQTVALIYKDFIALRDKFMQAAAELGGPDVVAQMGVRPPRFTDLLVQAGVKVPMVEEDDDHGQHLIALRSWTATDAFDDIPDPIRTLAREHREAHVAGMATQVGALAMQEPNADEAKGSAPNPRGEASRPKDGGTPSAPPPAGG